MSPAISFNGKIVIPCMLLVENWSLPSMSNHNCVSEVFEPQSITFQIICDSYRDRSLPQKSGSKFKSVCTASRVEADP